MRESKIESDFVDAVDATGGMALKFVSPGRRNVPDRLVLKNGSTAAAALLAQHFSESHHDVATLMAISRDVLAAYISFVEHKAPGKEPTPGQAREHARLRRLGFDVQTIDSRESIARFVGGSK